MTIPQLWGGKAPFNVKIKLRSPQHAELLRWIVTLQGRMHLSRAWGFIKLLEQFVLMHSLKFAR